LQNDEGIVLNTYYSGAATFTTESGKQIKLVQKTAYPFGNRVDIVLEMDGEESFAVQYRVPAWSKKHSEAYVNGEAVAAEVGYNVVSRTWKNGDTLTLVFDGATYLVAPPAGAVDEDKMRAIQRGPIVYAISEELGEDPAAIYVPLTDAEGRLTDVEEIKVDEVPAAYSALSIGCADGKRLRVLDYASAGRDYDAKHQICAWFAIAE
jgi:DUF1680 family protein